MIAVWLLYIRLLHMTCCSMSKHHVMLDVPDIHGQLSFRAVDPWYIVTRSFTIAYSAESAQFNLLSSPRPEVVYTWAGHATTAVMFSLCYQKHYFNNRNCILLSQEAGMFLRMASGLGFCQVGDYVASLFFLFRRRGHRYALAHISHVTCYFLWHDMLIVSVHLEKHRRLMYA